MEDVVIPVVQGASSPLKAVEQFLAFAEDQGGDLALHAKWAARRIADTRDLADELIWLFKVHAPEGYTLDAPTGMPIQLNYNWVRQTFDH